jgi:hypothetical protein
LIGGDYTMQGPPGQWPRAPEFVARDGKEVLRDLAVLG